MSLEEEKEIRPINPEEIEEAQEQESAVDLGSLVNYFDTCRQNFFEIKRVVWMVDILDRLQALGIIQKLLFWGDQEDKSVPIKFYISSPGGEVNSGFAIVDMIEELKRKGFTIETVCVGECCSMASVILAAGSPGHRFAFPLSRIMIHESGVMETGGKYSDMRTVTKELQISTDNMAKIYSKATGKTFDECKSAMNHDYYMSASEAKKFGIIDKIKTVLA